MDRYAIFVDAGYVYAAGGNLVLDTDNRAQVVLDAEGFLSRLQDIVRQDHPDSGDFLRIYWYDASPRGLPTAEHEAIGAIQGVKVRLGRLTRYGQKGVDALVMRDMMRLSAEHAICTAFLLTGDEDLRQAIIEAQDFGVKVVLLGIQATLARNQAVSLVQEADAARTLVYEELRDSFERGRGAALAFEEGFDAYAIGTEVGMEWSSRASEEEQRAVVVSARVPPDIYRLVIERLLEVGDLPPSAQVPEAILAQAREGFLGALQRPAPGQTTADQAAETPPAAALPAPAPLPATPAPTPDAVPAEQAWAFQEGASFGGEWLAGQPEDEVRYVRQGFPMLPGDIDSQLLRRLIREMDLPPGELIGDGDRKAARAGFWQSLGMELDVGRPRPRPRYEPISEGDPFAYGRAFARQWAGISDPADVERARNLVQRRIGLPSDADAAMLRHAAAAFGDPVPVDVRHRLRAGFGEELEVL
ncbi:MAG: NYN domain-containing protein [Dehalococcoidia bacterium]|jgi:uncharacterized LabA/DUF88 family protein